MLKISDIFYKAVHSIISSVSDYYKPRFNAEQASSIKSALNLLGDNRQSHPATGDFLYFTAKQKRELDNMVEGHYSQQKKDFR